MAPRLARGLDVNVEEVLKERAASSAFRKLIDEVSQVREVKQSDVQSTGSDWSLDICFAMDCTGSMSAWLQAAAEQIQVIAAGLVPMIGKKFPSLKVKARYAFVGYRDVGDQPQFEEMDFVDDVQKLAIQVCCNAQC